MLLFLQKADEATQVGREYSSFGGGVSVDDMASDLGCSYSSHEFIDKVLPRYVVEGLGSSSFGTSRETSSSNIGFLSHSITHNGVARGKERYEYA